MPCRPSQPAAEPSDEHSELEDFREEEVHITENAPTSTSLLFSDLGLNETVLTAVRRAQFENPSPVQALAIPKVLFGRDILCQAKSGTGKTAVFVLSLLQLLTDRPSAAYVVLAHTAELSEQITEEFSRFFHGTSLSVATVDQLAASADTDADTFSVLIGTPQSVEWLMTGTGLPVGRMVSRIVGVIVDECDGIIIDEGASYSLRRILGGLSPGVQVMMFTATLTRQSKRECLGLLKDPFLVLVDDASKLSLHGLRQYFMESREREKLSRLGRFLGVDGAGVADGPGRRRFQQAIVFCKAPQNALYIQQMIGGARAVTAYMSTGERIKRINEFKMREFSVLATTDILSRGIDIQNVDCVVNYDMPLDPQTYLHRAGRAGRFETSGTVLSLVNGQKDSIRLNEIMDLYEIDIEEYGGM